jgi:hypothetical protein
LTGRFRTTFVLTRFQDAQASCHLKAFLFEPSVAFWATTASAPIDKSGKRRRPHPGQQAFLNSQMTPLAKLT